jgi:hypothetical protein
MANSTGVRVEHHEVDGLIRNFFSGRMSFDDVVTRLSWSGMTMEKATDYLKRIVDQRIGLVKSNKGKCHCGRKISKIG